MASSRLQGSPGDLFAVISAPGSILELGRTFSVLGNELSERRWTGLPTGRPAEARERAQARPPYETAKLAASWAKRAAANVHDDELDDAEALRQCRVEQQRSPVHLVSAA